MTKKANSAQRILDDLNLLTIHSVPKNAEGIGILAEAMYKFFQLHHRELREILHSCISEAGDMNHP